MNSEDTTPIWKSRKFWKEVLAVIIFLVLIFTHTVEFTSEQVITIILGILGIGVGAHTVSDVASMVIRGKSSSPSIGGGVGGTEPLLSASQVERLIELVIDRSQLVAEEPKPKPIESARDDDEEGTADR